MRNIQTLALIAFVSSLAATPAAAQTKPADWKPLFDGKSLDGWRETPFNNHGPVRITEGAIELGEGKPMTGITWTTGFPKSGYEIRFEATRLAGSDFFGSLTFPVGESFCTWIAGGWGGDIVGLSSIDGWDASDNETRTYFNFENKRWYALRLRVTSERITGWIDDDQVFDVVITGRAISLRQGESNLSTPLGFYSYNTSGAVRRIEYRLLPAK
jgi:hypothetical protein